MPQCDIRGKFAVVRWTKATVLPGDLPVTQYIVQAKQLSASMFCSVTLTFLSVLLIVAIVREHKLALLISVSSTYFFSNFLNSRIECEWFGGSRVRRSRTLPHVNPSACELFLNG